MTKSSTVFICGTSSDLREERESILDLIRHLELRHASMEFFGARTEKPIETCLEEVRASDVLIVIVGHRYGSIVPDREIEISYSEAEYEEAYKLNKHCLVYIKAGKPPASSKKSESAKNRKLLEKWKTALNSRHTTAPYINSRNLPNIVAGDLHRIINKDKLMTKDPGDMILGVWLHYCSVDNSDYEYVSRFVVTKSDGEYYMSIIDQRGAPDFQPAIAITNVECDGKVWTFNSNWDRGEIGAFKSFRITDYLFEGCSTFNGELVQSDRLIRPGKIKELEDLKRSG